LPEKDINCLVSYEHVSLIVFYYTSLLLRRRGRCAMGAMNRYVTLQQLGDGTYGSVVLGQRVDTGEKVGFQRVDTGEKVGFRGLTPGRRWVSDG
jgi:hypothetical protein